MDSSNWATETTPAASSGSTGRSDQAAAGLQPHQPAEGRGVADRAAAVAPLDDGHDTGGGRRRTAAGRAGGGPGGIPGIAGGAGVPGPGQSGEAELRRSRAAQIDEA